MSPSHLPSGESDDPPGRYWYDVPHVNFEKPWWSDSTVDDLTVNGRAFLAIGDFARKRILNADLQVDSPYNTYKYKGLPPGPIRIPEASTMDSVLHYRHHNYLYMCAKEDFSGYHNFTASPTIHAQNAARYRAALNARNIKK